jgi:hypothetical protein
VGREKLIVLIKRIKIKEAGEELINKTLVDASSFRLMLNKSKFRI